MTRTRLVYYPLGCLYALHHVGLARSGSALSTRLRRSLLPVPPQACLQAHADPHPRDEAPTRELQCAVQQKDEVIHACRISPLRSHRRHLPRQGGVPCFSDTPDLGPQRNRVWTLARVSDELILGISFCLLGARLLVCQLPSRDCLLTLHSCTGMRLC